MRTPFLDIIRRRKKDAVQFPMSETQAFYRLAYNKEASDCSVRALAVACAAPYARAHQAMQNVGRLDGGLANGHMMMSAALQLGCQMVEIPLRSKTLRTAERTLRHIKGGHILVTRNHAVGVWDGELIDHARGTLARVKHAFRIHRRNL